MLLQARCSAQRGADPLELSITCSRLVHESSGCQKIAHVPLAQPCLPARLGGLQVDALAIAAQRAKGDSPARIVARILEIVLSLQGAKRLFMRC